MVSGLPKIDAQIIFENYLKDSLKMVPARSGTIETIFLLGFLIAGSQFFGVGGCHGPARPGPGLPLARPWQPPTPKNCDLAIKNPSYQDWRTLWTTWKTWKNLEKL